MVSSYSLAFWQAAPCKDLPNKFRPVPSIDQSLALFPNNFRRVPSNALGHSLAISNLTYNHRTLSPVSCGIQEEFDVKEEKTIVIQDEELPEGLRRECMPKHVAVMVDGHARWAKKNGLPRSAGYEAMYGCVTDLYKWCCKFGIPVLTVHLYTTQNMERQKAEVEDFLSQAENYISTELENFMKHGVKISFIGDLPRLSKAFQIAIAKVQEATKNNTKVQLILGVPYGGQYDILQACRSIAHKAKDGLIHPDDIDASVFQQHLHTNCTEFPNPDLLIRHGGELRLSDFYLWQIAYTEFFFAKPLSPETGEKDFIEALLSFQKRQRRFGVH